jgi:hypothetical protein
VTFLPQRYECNLDGKDMLAWECEHFPGLRYGDSKDLCWAWIMDSRLLETSLVFRNASPDAMLQRKIAEGIAQGEIPQGQLAYIAQRFALPTPTATRFVFQRKEEAVVEDKEKREGEGDPAEQPVTPPADPPKADAAEEEKPEPEGDAGEGGEGAEDEGKDEKKPEPEPEAAKPLTADERATAFAAILDTAEDGELAGLAGRFEDHFARKGAKLPGAEAAAAREAQVRGALGIDEHADIVAAATEARRKSGMADDLFGDLVTRTVKSRISAGFSFNEDAYRRQLTNSQDVEFVRSELASHEEARKDRWKPGRVVEPGDAEAVPPAEGQPQRHDSNVLETLTPRGDKGRSKSPAYAVPAKKS